MRVALVLPPITLEERYNKAISYMAGSLPPLGLISLGTMLKMRGHDVIVLDGSVRSWSEIMEEIERFGPEVIGITALTLMWPKAKLLSAELKRRRPELNIIVGGVHASIIREKALLEAPCIDAVAWGEGDFSLVEYLENVRNKNSSTPIDGIAFRERRGDIIKGGEREPIKDIDILPIPDRSLVPVTKYAGAFEQYRRLPVTNMFTTRGCPYRCLFCLPELLGKGVRQRSVVKVMEEIEYLLNDFGIKDIAFWDDTFTINRRRVLEICGEIKRRGIKFVWSAQARADCVDSEMLDEMAAAGCWKLFFGVESLVQKNLDTLRKGETVEEIFRAIEMAKEAGLEVETSFIIGIPGETYKEGLETIMLAKQLGADYAKFYYLSPYGSFLQEVKKYGTVLTEDESKFNSGNVMTFVPHSMTKEELRSLYYKAYRQFYISPAMMLKRLKKIFNPIEFKKSISGFIALMIFAIEELKHKIRKG